MKSDVRRDFIYEQLRNLRARNNLTVGAIEEFEEIHVPEIFLEIKGMWPDAWNFSLRRYMLPNQEDSGIYGARSKYRCGADHEDRIYVFQPRDEDLISDIEGVIKEIGNKKETFFLEDHFMKFEDRMDILFDLYTSFYRDSNGTILNPRNIDVYLSVRDLMEKL